MLGPVLAASLALWGCASVNEATDRDLTVFAAASLRDVFSELEGAWTATNPDSKLTIAYDGSNVLAAQIAEGAPADVFVSADVQRPRELVESGDAAGELMPFVRNRVTLVAAADDDLVRAAADLAAPGVRLVAAGPGVPITCYADEALAQLAATMPDPAAFVAAVDASVVSREDNVRAALAKVELGEGDAAIVYRTDALSSDGVREVPLPEGVDVTAEYAMVQVSEQAAAAELIDWLGGADARDILAAAGFEVDAP